MIVASWHQRTLGLNYVELITEESKAATKLREPEDYYFSDSALNNYFLIPLLISLALLSWGKRISFHFQRWNVKRKAISLTVLLKAEA